MTDEQKFKDFAKTIESPEKCIELCKKYLQKKGFTTYSVSPFEQSSTSGSFNSGIEKVRVQRYIDKEKEIGLSPTDKMQHEMSLRKALVNDISDELVYKNLIKIAHYEDLASYRTIYRAEINVLKGN